MHTPALQSGAGRIHRLRSREVCGRGATRAEHNEVHLAGDEGLGRGGGGGGQRAAWSGG